MPPNNNSIYKGQNKNGAQLFLFDTKSFMN